LHTEKRNGLIKRNQKLGLGNEVSEVAEELGKKPMQRKNLGLVNTDMAYFDLYRMRLKLLPWSHVIQSL
jgi:hypothetical protein